MEVLLAPEPVDLVPAPTQHPNNNGGAEPSARGDPLLVEMRQEQGKGLMVRAGWDLPAVAAAGEPIQVVADEVGRDVTHRPARADGRPDPVVTVEAFQWRQEGRSLRAEVRAGVQRLTEVLHRSALPSADACRAGVGMPVPGEHVIAAPMGRQDSESIKDRARSTLV